MSFSSKAIRSYQAIYQNDRGSEACADLLGKAESVLLEMLRYDAGLQPILELVVGALAQVEEAGREINAYGDSLETDPDRLEEVEARIIQLKQICRKYGPTLADAIAHSRQVQQDLAELSGSGQSLEVLEESYQRCQTELTQACDRLTQMRQKTAQILETLLVQELKPLAMEKVQFKVGTTAIPPTATGADRITFLFSPNPGEPLQPLTEIASGGEMSRFLLALKACFSQVDSVGTMVFDEIDVGVSGRVAQAIADKLHQLSRRHQVLCVTHQPIIAAMADTHYRVNKEVIDSVDALSKPDSKPDSKTKAKTNRDPQSDDIRTVVRVIALDDRQRREELAQLAGGKTDQDAIAFADSLLAQAANARLNYLPEPLAAEPIAKSAKASAKTNAKAKVKTSRRS